MLLVGFYRTILTLSMRAFCPRISAYAFWTTTYIHTYRPTYHAKSRLNTPVWGSLRSPNKVHTYMLSLQSCWYAWLPLVIPRQGQHILTSDGLDCTWLPSCSLCMDLNNGGKPLQLPSTVPAGGGGIVFFILETNVDVNRCPANSALRDLQHYQATHTPAFPGHSHSCTPSPFQQTPPFQISQTTPTLSEPTPSCIMVCFCIYLLYVF